MKTRTHFRRRSSASGAGQTMVEFAAIATALFLLMFGLMMLGSAVYSYNTVSNAAREAVRYAIVHSPTSAVPASTDQIQQIAINYAAGLNLTDSDIAVSWPADPYIAKKNDAQVQISYPYTIKIPFLKPVVVNLTSTSRMLVSQ
jgi:TadE-like protein